MIPRRSPFQASRKRVRCDAMDQPRRLLIVEDELEMLACLREHFTDHGHQVFTASTVEEALAWLNQTTLDMAFVDMRLARGHGRSVIQEIARRKLPIRMVVMTACDDLDLRRDLLAYGVTDYLFKPITLREVGSLLTAPSTPIPTPSAEADTISS